MVSCEGNQVGLFISNMRNVEQQRYLIIEMFLFMLSNREVLSC